MASQTPDITPAQVAAVVTAVCAELVTFGLLSGRLEHLIVGLAGIVLPFGWLIADAIIRHGRSRALAPAAVVVEPAKPAPPESPPAA